MILNQPAGQSLCEGNNVLFKVTATGENLTYKWKKNGIAITDNASITGSSTANLDLQMISTAMGGIYTCEVSNSCATIQSNPANLEIFTRDYPATTGQHIPVSRRYGELLRNSFRFRFVLSMGV